ncbi:MAG: hypothetical protein AVDCRST_MAG73-2980 [uncultured Thermomicrobiales bacterium]|uniref:Uncharacterized protein n=1 Tax=uncultured Thermomicrobiales bacterium TaxID=1645740 RepID=A0A6J4UNR5_9BACT|nr:MAG: hypothetical protein AVDCRST_MAG73-2980 [uncultured Thermomicrobiales bacterium]
MAEFAIGDAVTVRMPRGVNRRGVVGISVLYATSQEARFDGATGTVTEINPRGPYGVPLYLVDFREHKNKVAIPWQAQWFREEWIVSADQPAPAPKPAEAGELAAAAGWGRTTTGESS